MGTGRQWVLKWPNLLGELTQFNKTFLTEVCGNKGSRWDEIKWTVSVTQCKVLVSNYTWILTQFAATWLRWDAISQDKSSSWCVIIKEIFRYVWKVRLIFICSSSDACLWSYLSDRMSVSDAVIAIHSLILYHLLTCTNSPGIAQCQHVRIT